MNAIAPPHALHRHAHRPDLLVLGAGIVGISTAYAASRAGLDVLVVDRLPAAGLDTSFANGGQVSVSHAEPWATPSAPLKVLQWLGRDDSPLLFRPRFDPAQWAWLLGWMVECLPRRSRANTVRIVQLALASRAEIQRIRAEEGLAYDHLTRGILHFYRDPAAFAGARRAARLMTDVGCAREVVDVAEMVRIEPALAHAAGRLVGGTYTPADESGDAHRFTQALAAVCARRGVRFAYGTEATALLTEGARVTGAETRCLADGRYGRIEAAATVLALACQSPALARPLGIRLRVYPAKGYSVTIPTRGHAGAPTVSLTDDEYKLVYSRLGERLRVAGTAELSGHGRALRPERVAAILRNVRGMFPDAGAFEDAQAWSGLRPTTPSNVPYLGRTPRPGLYLNTGHGTLGWTMGPGTGALVAGMVAEDLRRGDTAAGPAEALAGDPALAVA